MANMYPQLSQRWCQQRREVALLTVKDGDNRYNALPPSILPTDPQRNARPFFWLMVHTVKIAPQSSSCKCCLAMICAGKFG